MAELPPALCRKGRPIDPEFQPDEEFYFRVRPDQIDGDRVTPLSIQVPAQSVNRQKYCPNPEWVLLPKYLDCGIAVFLRRDVPPSMTSAGNVTYSFIVEHDPQEENYSHSEVRCYRDQETVFKPNLKVNQETKMNFRMRFAEKMRVIRRPLLGQ